MIKKCISILLIFVFIISLSNFSKAETIDGTLSFTTPKTSHLKIGDTITITLESSLNIQAADMKIYYDNDSLEFIETSISNTHFTVENGIINICTIYEGDDESGFNSFTFTFKILKPGETKIYTEVEDIYSNINKKINLKDTSINLTTDYIINDDFKIIENNEILMLTGINDEINIQNILAKSNYAQGCNVRILDYLRNEITSGIVTTGSILQILNSNTNEVVEEYNIVIYGDTNLDGKISSIDGLIIVKNKLNITPFKNRIVEEAGRTSLFTRQSKSVPSAVDALICIKHKLGLEKIKQ